MSLQQKSVHGSQLIFVAMFAALVAAAAGPAAAVTIVHAADGGDGDPCDLHVVIGLGNNGIGGHGTPHGHGSGANGTAGFALASATASPWAVASGAFAAADALGAVTPVPEPPAALLAGAGLLGVAGLLRRRAGRQALSRLPATAG